MGQNPFGIDTPLPLGWRRHSLVFETNMTDMTWGTLSTRYPESAWSNQWQGGQVQTGLMVMNPVLQAETGSNPALFLRSRVE